MAPPAHILSDCWCYEYLQQCQIIEDICLVCDCFVYFHIFSEAAVPLAPSANRVYSYSLINAER